VLQTTQATVSRWCDIESDLDIPFGIIPRLRGDRMTAPVVDDMLRTIGATLTKPVLSIDINGTVDDNLLNIDVIQSKIIIMKDRDKHKALRACGELLHEIAIIEEELRRQMIESTGLSR